jgi:hypothetical protein
LPVRNKKTLGLFLILRLAAAFGLRVDLNQENFSFIKYRPTDIQMQIQNVSVQRGNMETVLIPVGILFPRSEFLFWRSFVSHKSNNT